MGESCDRKRTPWDYYHSNLQSQWLCWLSPCRCDHVRIWRWYGSIWASLQEGQSGRTAGEQCQGARKRLGSLASSEDGRGSTNTDSRPVWWFPQKIRRQVRSQNFQGKCKTKNQQLLHGCSILAFWTWAGWQELWSQRPCSASTVTWSSSARQNPGPRQAF